MHRCLELAKKGVGNVSPNPMVGCVIVHQGEIIGEGYHEKFGEAHAEVNAINSIGNQNLLKNSVLYVTLEPCDHYGLTPPCSNLIIEKQIPRVLVGIIDPNAKVAGKGIERMRNAGIIVELGMLENECREVNKRFFTFHEKKRPFIFLKWAQTNDRFIDMDRNSDQYGQPTWITGDAALKRVHKMRADEDAIMVGTNTALKDNPSLTVRQVQGKNPIRIVLDNQLRLPKNLSVFDHSAPNIVFNSIKTETLGNIKYIRINFNENVPLQIMDELYRQNIQSVIIEGGKQLIESFLKIGLWDEAFVFVGDKKFNSGVEAPQVPEQLFHFERFEKDELYIYRNFG